MARLGERRCIPRHTSEVYQGYNRYNCKVIKIRGTLSDVLCNIPSTTLICISPTLKLCCTKHLHWSVVCLGSTVHTCSILNGLREGQPTIMSPHDHGWHFPTSSTPLSLSPSQQQISYDCKLSFGVQTLRECYYLSTYTGYLLVL